MAAPLSAPVEKVYIVLNFLDEQRRLNLLPDTVLFGGTGTVDHPTVQITPFFN